MGFDAMTLYRAARKARDLGVPLVPRILRKAIYYLHHSYIPEAARIGEGTVFGYGGLQPLDGAKKQLPITLTRDTGRPATLVRLAPETSVGRTIHWTVVPSGSQPCPTPAYASIIPPDETSPLVIGWSLGPICGGKMDGWPYGVTL